MNHLPLPSTLRERIAQLIFHRIGSNLPPIKTVEEDAQRVADLLDQDCLGGLCLFHGTWPETRETLARLQSAAQFPLLVTADVERGAGQQVRGLTVFPHAMAFGILGDDAESLVEQLGRITARESLAAGIHIVLGPVADVDTNPRSPIIATRAFGQQPERVSRLVAAYVRGCQSQGAYCATKHFPGHGHTLLDSHDSLPLVADDRQLLERRDLPPFREAIAAGSRLIMTAHVAFPALDPSGAAATVSRPILQDLLRRDLQFDGVVITDSLRMAGVRDRFASEAEMALASLRAGADVLVDIADPPAVLDRLVECVRQGELAESQINRSFERLWALKSQLGAHLGGRALVPLSSRATSDAGGDSDAAAFALQVARQAIVLHGKAPPPPLSGAADVGVLVVKPFHSPWDEPVQPIVTTLRKRLGEVSDWELGPEPLDTDTIVQECLACERLIIALIIKPAAWQRFGLRDHQSLVVRQLVRSRPVTLVSLGVPAILDDYPEAPWRFCTFSDVAVAQQALAERLLGQNVTP